MRKQQRSPDTSHNFSGSPYRKSNRHSWSSRRRRPKSQDRSRSKHKSCRSRSHSPLCLDSTDVPTSVDQISDSQNCSPVSQSPTQCDTSQMNSPAHEVLQPESVCTIVKVQKM